MKGYIPDIIEEVKSGIIHIVHVVDGKRVSSGTGFMVNGYLVTNHHVIDDAPQDSKIVLRTYDSNPSKPLDGVIELIRDTDGLFKGNTNKGEIPDFNLWTELEKDFDYVVYNIPELRKLDLYNFHLDSYKSKREGEEILFIGYHFENYRIVSHRGFISSFYSSGNKLVNKIQVDASVNSGSSGSPLIDPNTSRVIGIITRKETGLSKEFNKLYGVIRKTKNNLENNRKYILSAGEFNSLHNRLTSQEKHNSPFSNRLEDSENAISSLTHNLSDSITELSKYGDKLTDLAKEIERSANVGIGYAYSVEHLMNRGCLHNPSKRGIKSLMAKKWQIYVSLLLRTFSK